MKINSNRDYESMKTEGYFSSESASGTGDAPYMNMNMDMGMNNCCYNEMPGTTMPGVVCPPIYECPRETVCHRYICHEVPHITPCNTTIINHHIYRHTYTPTYSCREENEVQNVYENRCC